MGVADEIPLVDHHCHPVVVDQLERDEFESLLTEAHQRGPTSEFDSQVGLAVRRWCAPLLDLDPHAAPDAYLARRQDLGPEETTRRLLRSCGATDLLVDTGLHGPDLCDLNELESLAEARVSEVTRMESVAEQVGARHVTAAGFGDAVAEALAEYATRSVGFKTIAAYRVGLDLPAVAPTRSEVERAAGLWLAEGERTGTYRLDDPTLVAHCVHSCLPLGLPIQVHTGYGDPDLSLHRSDPSLLMPFLRAQRGSVVLLHCYPYHRQAAYLANVFPHVALDVSLAVNHVGQRAAAVLAETLELAPFGSLLYASDGYGLPELHYLGAVLFRRALGTVFDEWLAQDALTAADALRFARMISTDNARRIYSMEQAPPGPPPTITT
jgi:predicted TIM-barrel fold metal-dependent hydrolase